MLPVSHPFNDGGESKTPEKIEMCSFKVMMNKDNKFAEHTFTLVCLVSWKASSARVEVKHSLLLKSELIPSMRLPVPAEVVL